MGQHRRRVATLDGCRRRAALAEILAAESLQARALREAVLELLPPGKGQRLREIDDSIATHRAKLQRPVE